MMPGFRSAVQFAEVQEPDIRAGDGDGWNWLQPEPELEATTLPETAVGTMIPVIVPLIEQLLQVAPENGIEKAPLLLTTIVPADCALQLGGPEPPVNKDTSARIT
jgi:hypothetical protein